MTVFFIRCLITSLLCVTVAVADDDDAPKTTHRVQSINDEVGIKLDEKAQQQTGIALTVLKPAQHHAEFLAYGKAISIQPLVNLHHRYLATLPNVTAPPPNLNKPNEASNADRETVCQCCQNEIPFKIGDAYYFEAVQCVKTIKNHHIENRLALCPTCAAMYRHARATDDTEIRRLIIEHETPDDAGSVEIPLVLANQPHRLRFVATHFFDLQTILAKAKA